MALTVDFYTFTKKTNSTKQPTGTAALSASCLLKDATSIIKPVIELKASDSPLAYNYAHISAFSRYYFIDDITWNAGVWEVSMTCDVLATYKSTIGSTSCYVLRSSNYYDGDIMDNLYPATSGVSTEIAYSSYSAGWPAALSMGFTSWDDGTFVVGIQGTGAGSVNGIIYYIMDTAKLLKVISYFYANSGDNSWWGNLEKGVRNALNSLDNYITSIRWYPYPMYGSTLAQDVYLGSWKCTDPNNALVTIQAFTVEDTRPCSREVTVMRHPQAATRGSYLNYAPYSSYEIVDPLVGVIPISSDIAKVINTIKCTVTPDYTTGQAKYELTTAGDVVFYTTYIKYAVEISLSGSQVNVGGLISSAGGVATTLAGVATGGAATAAAVIGDLVGIGNAATRLHSSPGGNQSSGGFVQYGDGKFMLRGYFKPIVNEDLADLGRPYCTTSTPATVRNYMVIDNPHVQISGTSREADMINAYMAGGFFYE